MRRGLLASVVVLCGCDGVFKLTEVPPPAADSAGIDAGGIDAVSACRYATVAADEPGKDEDGDGTINSLDPCPTVPGVTDHDEDADGIPDACDLCPTIVAAGDDADCDMVGAACDPDDSITHVQTIYGFGDAIGLSVYEVTVADDRVTGPTDPSGGDISTMAAVKPAGRYEISGHVRQIDASYRSIGIDFEDTEMGGHYELELGLDDVYWGVLITKDNATLTDPVTGLAKHDHGAPGLTELAYRIVVDYDGTRLTVTLSGDLTDTVSVAATLGSIRYGAGLYHDVPRSDLEVDWLRRVATE